MIEQVLNIDRELFRLINSDLELGFLEEVLILIRNAKIWIPLYLFVIIYYPWKYKRTGILMVITLICLAAVSDQLSSSIIKPWIERIRPCNDPSMLNNLIMRVNCGSGYSFTSSHATNHFAFAFGNVFFLGKRYKWMIWAGILWAGAISFAQVYVGVHYPVDVISGAFLGIFLGIIIPLIFDKAFKIKLSI